GLAINVPPQAVSYPQILVGSAHLCSQTYANLMYISPGTYGSNDPFTVNANGASPATISGVNCSQFPANQAFTFESGLGSYTGTGLTQASNYYVTTAGCSSGTFQFAASSGQSIGIAISAAPTTLATSTVTLGFTPSTNVGGVFTPYENFTFDYNVVVSDGSQLVPGVTGFIVGNIQPAGNGSAWGTFDNSFNVLISREEWYSTKIFNASTLTPALSDGNALTFSDGVNPTIAVVFKT